MKTIGIREANRSWTAMLREAQAEPVCLTKHRKPFALIVGLHGRDVSDVLKNLGPEFSQPVRDGTRRRRVAAKR